MKIKIIFLFAVFCILISISGCSCSCGKESKIEEEPVVSDTAVSNGGEIVELDDAAKAIVQICDDYEAFRGDDFEGALKRYNDLMYESEALGFIPVIVFPDDELVRNIYANFDMLDYQESKFIDAPESLMDFSINDIRTRALDANSTLLLTQLKADRNANFDTVGFESRKGSVGSIPDVLTKPDAECNVILILKFHTATPWDILCSLPLGGWNECPSAYVLASVAKRWYVECGAVPALISSRCLQFRVTGTIDSDYAKVLASEMYCIAPQSDLFECRSASGVGKHLETAQIWRFDWIRTK